MLVQVLEIMDGCPAQTITWDTDKLRSVGTDFIPELDLAWFADQLEAGEDLDIDPRYSWGSCLYHLKDSHNVVKEPDSPFEHQVTLYLE